MTIEQVVESALLADTTVKSIFGQSVFPVGAGTNPTVPYCTYACDEAETQNHNSGTADLKKYQIMIQFWVKDYPTGKAADAAIYGVLNNYRAGNTQRIWLVNRTDVDEDLNRWEATHMYGAWHSNTSA